MSGRSGSERSGSGRSGRGQAGRGEAHPAAGLDAALVFERGDFGLMLDLVVPPGTVTAIVGPNGAGKSTTLQLVAGLLPLTSGKVLLGDREFDGIGVHVPPAARGIGVVFQDYLLFPHLSVVDNVAFGLRARGMARTPARTSAVDRLDRLGLLEFAARMPGELSGGQAQRVALARALVLSPPLLLLDEPLAALDAATRSEVRMGLARELKRFGGSTVIVTHDPVDAMVMADEIVVLERGRAIQRGTPAQVTTEPTNSYVAELVGVNLMPLPDGRQVTFSPADVTLTADEPAARASVISWRCRVRGVENRGSFARVQLDCAGRRLAADVTAGTLAMLGLGDGRDVWASFPVD